MMDNTMQQIAAILTAIIGVAIVAVLVGRQSQTSSVIQSAASGFSSILGTALSPVGGSTGGASSNPFGG